MHTVTTDELGRRIDDDVETVFDRPEQGRRQCRVIDDRRQPVVCCLK